MFGYNFSTGKRIFALNNSTMLTIDDKTGLVLEGGGMRGVFTCGVLDYLLDMRLYFPYVVGVSAGACNGLSYLSHQRGRAKYSNIDLLDKYHYLGIKHLWTNRSILDMDLLYEHFPNEILPYDYDAYEANPARFEMVTTDCLTGRALYLEEKRDRQRVVAIARASASLPYVCPTACVDGRPMLDGGIVDSIPLRRAIGQGYAKNVVVLTRNKGYRNREKDRRIRFVYRNYPRLRVALSHRIEVYNEQLEMVEKMEEEGSIIAIRPVKTLEVDRMETDTTKLTALYEEGYAQAKAVLEKL